MNGWPFVSLTPPVWVDLLLAFDGCSVEVSGLGDTERHDYEWRITSLIVLPQRCSLEGTNFDELAHNHYMSRLLAEGRLDEINSINTLWWHSHVKMPAHFSSKDVNYIRNTFGRMVPRSDKKPWLVSIVGNKFHKLDARLDIFWPRKVTYEHLPIRLTEHCSLNDLRRLYRERRPRMEEIIKEMVTIVKPERPEDEERREPDE